MKNNILIVFFLAMIAFLPHSLAFSWQDDIDAAAQDASKTYEVYPHMPYSDFISAWSDVPGWSRVPGSEYLNDELKIKQAIFRKNETGNDGVIEEFRVFYAYNEVLTTTLCFRSEDKKVLNRIFNYATVRYNNLTKQHKMRKYNTYNHRLENMIWWRTSDDLMNPTFIVITLLDDKNTQGTQYVAISKSKELGQD